MVAYSFKKRFAEPILAGTKAQTIRGDRKRHARPGEPVQLFTGMRTKHCRRLGEPLCLDVTSIRIALPRPRQSAAVTVRGPDGSRIETPGWPVSLDQFAVHDGFRDFDDMLAFWRENHPGIDTFDGVLIRWKPLTPPTRSTSQEP